MRHLPSLVEQGSPVSLRLSRGPGEGSDQLFCELVQAARFGRSFQISSQACMVGRYVLSGGEPPASYYAKTRRYQDLEAARRAANTLPRLARSYVSLEIRPYQYNQSFDALILFLLPAAAMRIVQAAAYHGGDRVQVDLGGAASVCGEVAAQALNGELAISLGCKGSRKHSRYPDSEMIVGIPSRLAGRIEEALTKTPETPGTQPSGV